MLRGVRVCQNTAHLPLRHTWRYWGPQTHCLPHMRSIRVPVHLHKESLSHRLLLLYYNLNFFNSCVKRHTFTGPCYWGSYWRVYEYGSKMPHEHPRHHYCPPWYLPIIASHTSHSVLRFLLLSRQSIRPTPNSRRDRYKSFLVVGTLLHVNLRYRLS